MYYIIQLKCKSKIWVLISELLLDINMKDQSLVAQRVIYTDFINVLMKSVKQSNRRYKVALEENKQRQKKKNHKRNK